MSKQAAQREEALRLLGVAPGASAKEIRAAWRAMVRAYHPDQYRGDKEAASRRLAELNAAFDLVSAPAQPQTSRPEPAAQPQGPRAESRRPAHRAAKAEARKRAEARQRQDAHRRSDTQARKAAEEPRPSRERATRTPSPAETGFEDALKALSRRPRARLLGFV